MELWETYFIGTILTLIGTILTLIGIGITISSWKKRIENRLNRIEVGLIGIDLSFNDFNEFKSSIIKLMLTFHKDELFKLYDQYFHPYQTEEKELLEKLKDGTITSEEAKKLKSILKDRKLKAIVYPIYPIEAEAVTEVLLLILEIYEERGKKK